MSGLIALVFDSEMALGRVSAVDTSRVLIAVENAQLLPRAAVGTLVAIQGQTAQEFLIGITERVTRQMRDQIGLPDPLMASLLESELVPDDTMRIVLVGTYRSVDGSARNRFKRGADTFPQIDRECYLIEGGNLQRFMALLGKDLDPDQSLDIGHFVLDPSAVAILNGDRFFQRHAAVLGSTGSGKSYAVSLILERASARPHCNIVVLDMHGEYASLAHPPGDPSPDPIASHFKIAGPGDLEAPGENVLFLPYWLLTHEEVLSIVLDRSDHNAPNQSSRFSVLVRRSKTSTLEAEEREDVLATFTVDSPVPYELDDVIDQLKKDDKEMVAGSTAAGKQGEFHGKLTRFISRLEAKQSDRRYGFMFSPPAEASEYDWLADQIIALLAATPDSHGIKVVDFSEVPSDVLPVVTGVFARLLYDVQFWMNHEKRTPFVLVCDEAHLYLPVKDDADVAERQALASFERIAKEGRKYGVSILVVSQRPSDVSRTILSQCNNFLILRLTNDQDQTVVRKLIPDSLAGLLDGLPLLDTGEALLLGDAILLPARIKLRRPQIEPLSATRDFWTEWGDRKPESDVVREAIEAMRRQTR